MPGANFLIICPQDSSIGPSTEKCEKGRHFKYVKTNEINFLFKLNIKQSHDKFGVPNELTEIISNLAKLNFNFTP